jgi:hypothetical protein
MSEWVNELFFWWNDIDRGKPKNSEKILFQCRFAHHKSHCIDLGANPGRRGERLATNCLSHDTAYWINKHTISL